MDQIRDMINKQMKRRGVSIYALAKSSGIPYRTLHDFVSGKTSISSDKLPKLFTVLEIEIKT
jgi:plasmid maintenance system antidote protein VapI